MKKTIKASVFYDVVCPWCLLGLQSWTSVIEKLSGGYAIEISLQPFVLRPDVQSPGIPVGPHLEAMGYNKQLRDQIWQRQIQEGEALGLKMKSNDAHRILPSLPGHIAIEAAKRQGKEIALAKAILSANFEHEMRIDLPEVLLELARNQGLDFERFHRDFTDPKTKDLVKSQLDAASREGVKSVPTAIIEGAGVLSGFHQPTDLRSILKQP